MVMSTVNITAHSCHHSVSKETNWSCLWGQCMDLHCDVKNKLVLPHNQLFRVGTKLPYFCISHRNKLVSFLEVETTLIDSRSLLLFSH